MQPIRTFTIIPSLPDKLQCLREMAYNLFWSWDREIIDLFRRLDQDLWEETKHSPVKMLGNITQEKLEAAEEDEAFIANMDRVYEKLKSYMTPATPMWYEKTYGKDQNLCVAYFSAEFGITDCMPIYSGGLGVLSGDHLKSSSDLGLPLIGVGLLYQRGYFQQYLNADGWQQESYPDNDFYNMAVQLEQHKDGKPITITVNYPGGPVKAQIWRAQVGRVALYMLDTNIPANSRSDDKRITYQLYAPGQEIRIRQEIMLGIGGVKALEAVGIRPMVYHMNEGHSAFLALERICCLMAESNLSFRAAKEVVSATNVFTTHTPVPAGIDVFSEELMAKYFKSYARCLGISLDELLALGRQEPDKKDGNFSMAVLALRLAAYSNGVSELHGKVSRRMWMNVWPGVPEDEVPITSIVNGVHVRSWVSNDMEGLFDRYLDPQWTRDPSNPEVWEQVKRIPDDELWRTHERRRERLVAFARRRLIRQLDKRGALASEIAQASESLDPEALTIGFARRFATYKRATLILRDQERLAKILNNEDRPVQIIFAGKAHPQDTAGKELIQEIIHIARREEFQRKIVFVEDYDMIVARYLVQGVDLWLNTPLRPSEASGTSGMKAAINGVINMSILDGWWHEAYKPELGWSIGLAEDYNDEEYQDNVESNTIYEMLEKEVIPMFYTRGPDRLPRQWIARMKASMSAICPVFNTNRMVHQYIEHFYHPCSYRWLTLTSDDFAKARELASWKDHITKQWPSIRIDKVEMDEIPEIKVGGKVTVRAQLHLGSLTQEDVAVETYVGPVDSQGGITHAAVVIMNCTQSSGDGNYTFEGVITSRSSGLHGYSVRVLPRHGDLSNPYEMGLILWAP